MSWVRDSNLTWIQRFAVRVIRSGPIPSHVAFIMDGNRRFATKTHLKSKTDGHVKGFDKLAEALQWCLDIGIKEVTVYAFSIENFKRSKVEVDTLMELAKEKFAKLMEEKDKLNERGICIRIVGNMSMLPIDLQQIMAEAILLTKDNCRAILNVAFAYTSRDEITESIRAICNGVNDKELAVDDISEELIRQCMYTNRSSDPDLLVRTGESRLSDFMLYQCSTTVIYFTETLWPEFTIWHLLAGIFYYQQNQQRMATARRYINSYVEKPPPTADRERIEAFVNQFEKRRIEHLKNLVRNGKTNRTFEMNELTKVEQ